MASLIKAQDVKLMQSEVLLDVDDGGGYMSPHEVVDGESNNLFPDVSEMDRTYGRIALRKAFLFVEVASVDSYYGAHFIIAKPPTDPNISASLFNTQDWFDHREDAQNRIETYLSPSIKIPGHLLETQVKGARAIQQLMKPADEIPEVGQTLMLIENEDKPNMYYQYVRVSKLSTLLRMFSVQGKDWQGKIVTIEITDPLQYDFHGIPPTPFDDVMATSRAFTRDTLVADAARYYGIAASVQDISSGDISCKVDTIYTHLVPSTQSEIAIVDADASGAITTVMSSASGESSFIRMVTIGNGQNLYIGSGVTPGTLRIQVGPSTYLTDSKGVIYSGGTQVGTVDYGAGICYFPVGGPVFTGQGSYLVYYIPAVSPFVSTHTELIHIVENTRGFTYTFTFTPIPAPKSLKVSYMAQGKWYDLIDVGPAEAGGAGILSGGDSAIGAGNISYTTGSMVLSLGSLPDADSDILFAWGTETLQVDRSTFPVNKTNVKFNLQQGGVKSSSISISWLKAGTPPTMATATDDGAGKLVGDASGVVRYADGTITMYPNVLPLSSTEYTVDYAYGDPSVMYIGDAAPINGNIVIDVPGGNLIPNGVIIMYKARRYPLEGWGKSVSGTLYFYGNPLDIVVEDIRIQDDGQGHIVGYEGSSVNYATGRITFNPSNYSTKTLAQYYPYWRSTSLLWVPRAAEASIAHEQITGTIPTYYYEGAGADLEVNYYSFGSPTNVEEKFTKKQVDIDLTSGFSETLVPNSIRFAFGGKQYFDRDGSLYTDLNQNTGAALLSGSVNLSSGVATLNNWDAGAPNSCTLISLLTSLSADGSEDKVTFRIPGAPIRPGSFQIRGKFFTTGQTFAVTADTNGYIEGTDVSGTISYKTGIVALRFGTVVPASGNENQPWYNPDFVVDGKIWRPAPVVMQTMKYNAVGYTYLPLDEELLGLNPVRLPPDGRVPIFRIGDVAVVHNSQHYLTATPTVGTPINLGRERVYSVRVEDGEGTVIPDTAYDVDLDAGILTFNSSFIASEWVMPIDIENRIEDMAVVGDVQINGILTFTRALTHAYPIANTYVSSAVRCGDLQARAYNVFTQAAWLSHWQDSPEGGTTIGKLNVAMYPIKMSDAGAAQERWAIIFDSATSFRVIAEHLGQVATGNTSTNVQPINPNTHVPYFIIDWRAFGTGWITGNVIRWNTAACNYPVWVARTVLQGPSSSESDEFSIQIRGNIDR